MQLKRVLSVLVMLFAAIYYAARVGIFYLGATGEMQFEEEQSALVEAVVIYCFLAIGVAGILMLPGVYLRKPWGFWGTIAIGVFTIIFDVWAYLTVQSSAAAGIIPAAILTGYLLLTKKDFVQGISAKK